MFSKEYEVFRNQYQSNKRFDSNISYALFHTTPISNLKTISKQGLLSIQNSGSSEIGWGLGPSCSKYFTRLFHVDNTPFLYNRYTTIGGCKIALLIISSKIFDDKSVSLIGMSTHGLPYWRYGYFKTYFIKTNRNLRMTDIESAINNEMPTALFYHTLDSTKDFFSKLTEDFNLPAQGDGWSRGEVLFSQRAAYPGQGAGQWGNIRAAEILIYPKVPTKYIIGVACTAENMMQVKNDFPEACFFNLNSQGIGI